MTTGTMVGVRNDTKQDRQHLWAWISFAAVSFFWGTTYLAIRVGVQTLPPAFFAGARFLIAGSLLWIIRRMQGDPPPRGREWLTLTMVGLLLLVSGNGLVVLGEQWVESGVTALAVAMMPIWIAVLSAFIPGGERISGRGAAGLLLGIVGLLLLLHPAAGSVDAHRNLGIGLLELACFSWAGGTLVSKRRRLEVSPLMGAAGQMLTAGIILLVIAAARGEFPHVHFTAAGAGSLAYLAIFGSLVAYSAYMFALAHLPATTVSLYSYINPVVALVVGAIILSEPLSWGKIGAAGIILCGVALARSGVRASG